MPTPPRAFVASATRVRLSEKPKSRKTAEWQADAWMSYENVGEIQHAIDYIANHISKVRLFGALVPTDPRDPPKADPEPTADAAITSLHTEGGEYSAILRELTVNLQVAGECYLVGRQARDGQAEFWEIRSTDELTITDNRYLIRDYPSGPREEFTDAQLVVIHIMYPHPRWGGLPISPIRGILASADEIQRIERVIRAAAKSRSAGPGLLLMPDEASFGNADPTTESSGDGEALGDPFMRTLMDAMITPIQEEGSASAVVPLLVRAPSDVLDNIRKVSLAIDIDTELIKLDRALTRLAQGLPLPPEVVTGKSGLSHWSAWQVAEETITAYIEPIIAPIVNALTVEYYRPFLIASGISESEARTRMLWYDVTVLVTRPNRSADADFGLKSIAISDDTWRRIKGFTEADAPDPLEKLARLLLQRGSFDPTVTAVLLQVLGIVPRGVQALPIQQPPTQGPPQSPNTPEDRNPPPMNRPRDDSPPTAASSAPLVFLPPAIPDAEQISIGLAELDRELRIRLQTAAEASMTRGLERASSIIHAKFRRASRYSTLLREIPKLEAASRIGRPALEAEGIIPASLFDGAFDSLRAWFIDWVTRTYTKAARLLSFQNLILVPTDLIASSADDLVTALTQFAVGQLFDSSHATELFGEGDDSTSIPHGLIRHALYRAGGGTDLLPSDASPPTAIAAGSIILHTIHDAGGTIDGWEWCYLTSVRTRDFEPHAILNGVRFSTFSDRALANTGTWPPVTNYYPGDHQSCFCAVRPLLSLPVVEAAS